MGHSQTMSASGCDGVLLLVGTVLNWAAPTLSEGEPAAEVVEEAASAAGGGAISTVTVGIALAAVVITLVLLAMFRGKSVKADAALLLGLQESGKSALYTQLRFGVVKDTVTSLDINEGPIADDAGGSVTVIDVPGHPRQQEALLPTLMPRAVCVVFVIDSKEFSSKSSENATRVLDILSSDGFPTRRMLVACNKADYDLMASKPEFIRKRMEKEIDLLLTTRRNDIIDTDNSRSGSSRIEDAFAEGEKFTFEGLAAASGGWQVDFQACSAKNTPRAPIAPVKEYVLNGGRA